MWNLTHRFTWADNLLKKCLKWNKKKQLVRKTMISTPPGQRFNSRLNWGVKMVLLRGTLNPASTRYNHWHMILAYSVRKRNCKIVIETLYKRPKRVEFFTVTHFTSPSLISVETPWRASWLKLTQWLFKYLGHRLQIFKEKLAKKTFYPKNAL